MARDASGNYTLPIGNPVISGTIITSAWANDTMGDVSAALTDSLSRAGNGGMQAKLSGIAGTANVPSFSFSNNVTSGLYSPLVNDVRMSVAAVDQMRWTADNPPQIWDGTAWNDVNGGGITWLYQVTVDATVEQGKGYVTAGNQSTLMPATPSVGQSVAFADLNDNWDQNPFTINGNGNTFAQDGSAVYTLDLKGAFAQFAFINSEWEIVNFGRLSDAYGLDINNLELKDEAYGRNLIINGGFDIWQRGSPIVGNTYSADRWIATSGAITVTLGVAPITLPFSRKAVVSRSSDGARLMNTTVEIRVEGDAGQFIVGSTWTVSYYVLGSVERSTTTTLEFADDSGGTNSVLIFSGSKVVPAGVWTRVVETFTVESAPVGTTACVRVRCGLSAMLLAEDMEISGVKLETGSIATPFTTQGASIGEELALCQRYYAIGENVRVRGSVTNGQAEGVAVFPPVTMRDAPTVTTTITLATLYPSTDPATAARNKYSFEAWLQPTATGSGIYGFSWTADAEL